MTSGTLLIVSSKLCSFSFDIFTLSTKLRVWSIWARRSNTLWWTFARFCIVYGNNVSTKGYKWVFKWDTLWRLETASHAVSRTGCTWGIDMLEQIHVGKKRWRTLDRCVTTVPKVCTLASIRSVGILILVWFGTSCFSLARASRISETLRNWLPSSRICSVTVPTCLFPFRGSQIAKQIAKEVRSASEKVSDISTPLTVVGLISCKQGF